VAATPALAAAHQVGGLVGGSKFKQATLDAGMTSAYMWHEHFLIHHKAVACRVAKQAVLAASDPAACRQQRRRIPEKRVDKYSKTDVTGDGVFGPDRKAATTRQEEPRRENAFCTGSSSSLACETFINLYKHFGVRNSLVCLIGTTDTPNGSATCHRHPVSGLCDVLMLYKPVL
jgi:hypothetical protein